MQLIDTDADIGVQTKMSTMQPESLEKFNLIDNVSSDITDNTNGNEECLKKQEFVKVCQKNIDEEQNAQRTVTRHLLNEKRNEKYDDTKEKCDEESVETKEKCDKESVETKENSNFEDSRIIRIENDDKVQEQTNNEVSIQSDIHSGEVILDTEMKNVDNVTDNSENESVINKTKKESHPNCEMEQDILDNTVIEDTIEGQDNMDRNMTEDRIENQIKEDVEMDITFQDDTKVTNSLNENKIDVNVVEKSKVVDAIEEEIKDDVEMDITFEKQGADNNNEPGDNTEQLKDKFEEPNNEKTEKHGGVCTRETENNSKNKDIIQKRNEDFEINANVAEEGKLNTNVTEDKIENEMVITFEEEKRLNKISKEYEIKNENKEKSEIDENIEKQKRDDIEREVTLEKQYEVISCTTITTNDFGLKKLPIKNSEKDFLFPGQGCEENIERKDKIEEQDKKINATESNQNMMEVTEEDKVSTSTEDKIEHDARPNCEAKKEHEESPREKIHSENVPVHLKQIQVQNNVNRELIESKQVNKTSAMDVNENQYEEYSEMNITSEQKSSLTNNTIKEGHSKIDVRLERDDLLDNLKEISNLQEQYIDSVKEDSIGKQVKENSEAPSKLQELITEKGMVPEELDEKSRPNSITSCSIGDPAKKESVIEDKFLCKHNENKVHKISLQDVEENLTDDNNVKKDQKCSKKENKVEKEQTVQVCETTDALKDSGSSNECIKKHENNKQQKEKDSDSSNGIAKRSDQFEKIQEVVKVETQHIQEIVNKTNSDFDKLNVDKEIKPESRDSKEDNNKEKCISNSETEVMDTDEIIDIADEKDDIDQGKESPENKENVNVSKQKTDLEDTLSREKPATESLIQDTNDQQKNVKKSRIDNVEEKKKLTHISKLSNTLDILSDEEDSILNDKPQKNVSGNDEKQCSSINIDDDDDIMLIDDEPKYRNDKNQPESLPEPESKVDSKEDTIIESKDKEEQCTEIFESKKDSIKIESTTPGEIKTSEPEQEGTPIQKKPLVQLNFLKSCIKNLGDMTRDELEEFCILKIVESVVDRSNLSEIKSQLKTMAQNIEEYKKKASILAKQNRDLQVVIKSVQEEQKKKSNMPITPLKITRSVGMQVLMTDKIAVRKKIQNTNQNSAPNSGSNRQGKATTNPTKLQKMLTSANNSPPIPVPRLVPAGNNNNSNNVKTQSPSTNTAGKSQATGSTTNSPMQTVSNGLLAATPPAQKPEKRPHSRMQQGNNSLLNTVDLTDDEPPTKVVSRNIAPPVRLVPPQNLLAPNRQPFGANASNPRKVYIPISGSQTPVGVKPGQTIMLKTISPQGPRQRVPTPLIVKSNQNPTTVRMQRVTSRHPAPLPDSVKQYQPLNWKALPPSPELKLSKVENGIVISWKIDRYLEEDYEEIASYQLYAYQETSSPPSTTLWKKIGDVKALPLPMACTLTQFMSGYKYYFAVRAVDIRSRLGPFSMPASILLLDKM
ncbi:activating transcription factor 7-interacting protein 1 [Pararge aegeria]|nr:activating transcription factor 7-interacting protein 1 [Pararge aegeria]XP_039755356.1 activating transcription factor 7-interacting protein 1 [Pararge aegeria]XP_039755357.1 activating transcription factor 7-interacting protein 1 [Pararge aegeria]XP_039755358.1 activating transcription factor 7-interacting protein 1 [Pararge aegeria]